MATSGGAGGPAAPTMIWFEAIARRLCVLATYNGVEALLAPHVLYLRGGQPYVAAVALERRGLPVAETKLGIFAVAGLGQCQLSERTFSLDPAYAADDPRFTDALFAVEPG